MIDLGTAARKFKNEKVKIGFYNASITNLNGFEYGKKVCESCNNVRRFFAINPNLNPNIELICIECLESIKIITSHDTVFGYVATEITNEMVDESALKHVSKESFEEMQRTPNFLTLQGEQWMGHCNDFMDYIGTWEAPDFTKNSNDGNGKSLFKEMTHEQDQHLWDGFELAENETNNTWEDCLYHTFECRKCKIKKGYWEL